MKRTLFLIILLAPLFAGAQHSFSAVAKDSRTGEILVGVSARIKKININAVSDTSGRIVFRSIPDGEFEIEFSCIGYENEELEITFPSSMRQPAEVLMKNEAEEMEEVVVVSTRTNSRIEDVPIRIEVIGEEEVNEEVNIKPNNISKLLMESPSVQAQQTSAVNGSVSLRLQGLDGRYTQLLKDGFPLYGGLSQGLSVTQIPPLDLRQVEIVKGSSSSLYGSDAIGGLINLISKEPKEERDLTLLVNQTSLLGTHSNAWYAQRFGKTGVSMLASGNFQQMKDVDKDGFSDLAGSRTFNANPSFYYYPDTGTSVRFSMSGMSDFRTGGDMIAAGGSPDESHTYYEKHRSERLSSGLGIEKYFSERISVSVKSSACLFTRSAERPKAFFGGEQRSSYSEASVRLRAGRHVLVGGATFFSDRFLEDSSKSRLLRNYDHYAAGVLLQDDWKPSDKIVLQAGFRSDRQNRFGYFFLPRIAALYHFNEAVYVRAGGGMGYKIPTVFSVSGEQSDLYYIQPPGEAVKAERSVGYNLDLNGKTRIGEEMMVTLNQSFFVTQIHDPVVADSSYIVNKEQPVLAAGSETNIRCRMEEWQVFAAYSYLDVKRKYDAENPEMPLTPRHKINLDIIYGDEDDFSAALEGYYVSSMQRDGDVPTQAYFTIGVIVQKHFEHFSLIANCENILDVRQSRFENMVTGSFDDPAFREVYAPLEGRVFNLALRVSL